MSMLPANPETRPPDLALIDRWLEKKRHNEGCSERTILLYQSALQRLRRYLEDKEETILTVTQDRLEDFTGRYLHQMGLRPRSRRVSIAALRGFFGWAFQKGLIAENPARGLPSPRIGQALPRPMAMNQAEKLLMQPGINTFIGLRDTAILAILIGTGCRLSGVTNLNERDLVWTRSESGTERLVIRFIEKGKKERLVPVPLEASLLIRAYLGHSALDQIERELPNGDRVLFVNTRNRYVRPHEHIGEARRIGHRQIDTLVRVYGQRAGIPAHLCHAHALRHLYGTELAEHDVDLLERQTLLGHAKPETTAVYTHLAMRKLLATVDKASPISRMPSSPAFALAEKLRHKSQKGLV